MLFKKLLVLVCLLFPTLLFSQSFNAELSAGITANQIDGDRIAGYNKFGLIAGGGVGIPLIKDRLFLRSNFYYIQKGSRSTAKDPFYFRWSISYLEIPLTLRYMFTQKIYGEAGMGADILLGSKIDVAGFGYKNNSGDMRTVIPVLTAGIGSYLSPRLALNLRFSYSVISAGKLEASYTNTIGFFLSYKLK